MPKTRSKVMILYEDKRTCILDVGTEDRLNRSALQILTARFGKPNKWYYLPEPSPPDPLPFTRKEYEDTEEGDKKDWMRDQIQQSIEDRKHYTAELRQYQAIQKCIAEKDAPLAIAILMERRRHEHPFEDFEIRDVHARYEL